MLELLLQYTQNKHCNKTLRDSNNTNNESHLGELRVAVARHGGEEVNKNTHTNNTLRTSNNKNNELHFGELRVAVARHGGEEVNKNTHTNNTLRISNNKNNESHLGELRVAVARHGWEEVVLELPLHAAPEDVGEPVVALRVARGAELRLHEIVPEK